MWRLDDSSQLRHLSLSLESYPCLNLKLFEFSSVGATSARPQGVCLSIFLFVHSVWQAVAWDTCSKINLQGLAVYEKLPVPWQSARCRHFTHRSKRFEPNSGCSFILSLQSFTKQGDRKSLRAEKQRIYFCSAPMFS